jgi:diguanylate cyclase (GGDEF)-like protein
VTAINRVFAALLFFLFVFVGLSMAGSWNLRYRLLPQPSVVAQSDSSVTSSRDAEELRARIEQIRAVRSWTTTAQGISLLLCCALCVLGLVLRHRVTRDALEKEEAERALDRERRALEARIQDRTRELSQEVIERRRAEELNRGQKQVLEMLATDPEKKTEDILLHLTETVAAQRRSWECSLHLVEDSGKTLRLVASSEVNERLTRYLLSIGTDFPDAPESRACISGQTHVVEKMVDVRRPWSELLVANGVFSAWSVPFHTNDSSVVAGTLTVYSRLQDKPGPRDIELVETAARLAALVIEHRRIHSELVDNAYQDALTGLPNRRAGEEAIESAIQRAAQNNESVAVLWLDLNRFKRINDQYGHGAGDLVLRTISTRLRRHPLAAGGVARMGGDEFLVLVPGWSDSRDPIEFSRQLGTAIAEPITLDSTQVSVSASIGVCVYPRDGAAIDALERNADFAMYRAKAGGLGACIYSPTLSEEVSEALEIEQGLSVALEQNLLRLVYQPIFGQDGHLSAFEALLRFQHPRLGNISPTRFIPIAEETHLIVPIGTWVLRQACRQLKAWKDAGHPAVRVGVNISALQFARRDFAGMVAGMLRDFAISPECLLLELTESVVMEDYSAVLRQMNLLQEFGIRIAMDDFGTGYSSLSYLHKLPINMLKIDRSFIERLGEVDGTRPIVEAVISMGEHLGLEIVAEGVETREQQLILQEAGCHRYQGFLFSRPLPLEEAGILLAGSGETLFGKRREGPIEAEAVLV